MAEIKGAQYWRYPFISLCEPKQLSEYMIIEVEIVQDKDKPQRIPVSNKHVLADVCVQQLTSTGLSDQQYFCRTHLGHLLNPGDTVLGFNFTNSNLNHAEFDKMKADKIPDVMLVKKVFGDKNSRSKKRKWKLKHLHDDLHVETSSNERDYTDFLEDLEEDPAYRQNVEIYKDASKIAVDENDTDDEGLPQISLQEMLDDLHISTDATGEDGADMMTE